MASRSNRERTRVPSRARAVEDSVRGILLGSRLNGSSIKITSLEVCCDEQGKQGIIEVTMSLLWKGDTENLTRGHVSMVMQSIGITSFLRNRRWTTLSVGEISESEIIVHAEGFYGPDNVDPESAAAGSR